MSEDKVDLSRRRRLADLYVRGKVVELTDDNDEELGVSVWVHKISPLENKRAMDQANTIRAKMAAARFADDEDEFRLALAGSAEMAGLFDSRPDMIDYIKSEEISRARQTIEAELGDDEEWSKNGYLEGLRESWYGEEIGKGLREQFALNPDHAEASAVYKELVRFIDSRDALLEREKKRIRRDEDRTTDKELRHMVVDALIQAEAENTWYSEFRKRQLFYSIREVTDHQERYFKDVEELEELNEIVVTKLLAEFDLVNVEVGEGKD